MSKQPNQEQKKPGENNFARNVIKLSTGDFIAQIISMGAVPIITRLYAPGEYGVFSIYLSIVMVLYPISTLRFCSALMLPKDRNDAANLLGLSVLSVICCSILLSIVIFIAGTFSFIPKSWLEKNFAVYIFLIPLGVLVQGTLMSISFWALRNKMFGNMAIARITESVADRVLVLGAGFLTNPVATYLIYGRIIGPFVALCIQLRQCLSYEVKALWKSMSFSSMFRLARRYSEYNLLSTGAFFMNNLGRSAPVLLLAMFYSPLETGLYALSTRMIQMPLMLIGESISKVFLQQATFNSGNATALAQDTKKLLGYLVYISLPLVVILTCFGNSMFGFIFGPKWTEAGTYTQIIAISFLAMFLYRPLSAFFDAFERPRAMFIYNFIFLIGRVGAILVGGYLGKTIISTLVVLTATTCILYTGAFMYLFRIVGVTGQEVWSIIIKKAAIMSPIMVGISFAKLFMNEYLIMSTVIVAGVFLLQIVVILKVDQGLKRQLQALMSVFLASKWARVSLFKA